MATQYDPILKDSTGQAIVTKLEGIKNAINPTAENIPITTIEGMEAENVQEGLEELKQSLDYLVNYDAGEITVTTSPTSLTKVGEVTIPPCKSYIIYVCGVYQNSNCKEIAINTHNSVNDVLAYNNDQYKGSRAIVIGAGSSDQNTILDIWGSWASASANFVKYRLTYFK